MGFTPEQIKGRIKSVAKQNNADARTLMRIYMMERFLERLAQSEYRDNFILKGGILVTAMIGVAHRSTMDIDTSMKNLNLSAEDIPRKRFDGSLDYYKALLRTIRREQFIDEHILGISKEKYSAYIEELEGAGYIKKVEPDAGISGYILTTKGNDELTKKGEISFVKELNIQPQIGLINIQNSVSGSVF